MELGVEKVKTYLRNFEAFNNHDFISFLGHSRNYITANVFLKGLSFLTIPVFTRLLTPADYGLISVYTTLTTFLAVLFNLGFDGALFRYYYEEHDDFGDFLGTNLISFLVLGVILSFILFFLGDTLSVTLNVKKDLFYYSVIASMISLPFLLLQSYYQSIKNSKGYSYLNVIKYASITLLTILIVILLKEDKYYGRPYSELIIGFLILFFIIPKLIRLSKFKFKFAHLKYVLVFGIPLLPHSLSQLILSFFDRIIINKVSGENDVGLYAFAFNIGMIMNVIVMGMNQSWVPILYEKLKDGLFDDIKSLASKYSKIIFLVAVFLILFTNEVVKVLGEKRYLSSSNIVPFIVVGYTFFFMYTLYSNFAFYEKKTFSVSLITIFAGVLSIVFNFILVPIFGYKVSAINSMFSYFLLFLFHFINVKFFLKIKGIIELKIVYGKFVYVFIALIIYYSYDFYSISDLIVIPAKILLLGTYIFIEFKLKNLLSRKSD